MLVEDLKTLLSERFPGCEIEVAGDGRHFQAVIVSPEFESLNSVKRQQLVYAALKQQIADGSVHALSMKTLTPSERSSL